MARMHHRDESNRGTPEVRRATEADTEFLVDLARVAYADVVARQFGGWQEGVHGARYLQKIREQPFDIILLDGVRAGTVQTIEEHTRVVVNELVVHPDFQGRGIGTWALEGVLRQARFLGKPVWLHTMCENHTARAFYRRHGFIETAVRDVYVEMEAR